MEIVPSVEQAEDACTPTPGCQCVTTAKHTNSTSN